MIGSWHGQTYGIAPGLFVGLSVLALILFIVVFVLKAYSLWYSARRGEKIWFIVFLLVNTVGILELIYLIFVVKKWHKGIPANNQNSTPTQA